MISTNQLIQKYSQNVRRVGGGTTRSAKCRLDNGDYLCEQFVIDDEMGTGRNATVFGTGDFAVKVFHYGNDDSFEDEVRILTRIEHAGGSDAIVKFNGIGTHFQVDSDFMPRLHSAIFLERGFSTLSNVLNEFKDHDMAMPMTVVRGIMRQVFSAIAWLHAHDIVSADVNPNNIIIMDAVDAEDITNRIIPHVKLCDFGLATAADDKLHTRPGTLEYLPPEVIIGLEYDCGIDVWSAFVTLFELATNFFPFDVDKADKTSYGAEVDDDEIMVGNIADSCTESTESTDSSTDSTEENSDVNVGDEFVDDYTARYRHLLLIARVIGYPCAKFVDGVKANTKNIEYQYYNHNRKLMSNPDLVSISIKQLINLNSEGFNADDAEELDTFCSLGFRYLSTDRISAECALQHSFFTAQSSKSAVG